MLRTCNEWIRNLAADSSLIAEMQLGETFIENADLNADAFKLANCDAHRRLIIRTVDGLITNDPSSGSKVRDLLRRLVLKQQQTHGAFAELATYDWLIRCNVRITPQVKMTPDDVLGTNGSTLVMEG
jgi:hypothetical protein